ncbi:MAG: sulfotransferase family protein [Anaerolineae bacterium]
MFNFGNLLRFTYRSFFTSRGTPYRLTFKRIGWLLLFYFLFPLWELFIWTGLWLDDLFYPAYREVEIKAPIFIIGNPRSGTTFLHRLLAQDTLNFTSIKTWELLLAPSITLRRMIRALAKLDRRLGKPLRKPLFRWQRQWQRANVVHKVALRAPEEDEYLLIHLFSTLKVWTFAAMLEEAQRYTYFDAQIPQREKQRIMRFYKRCLQRHLYAHSLDGNKIYLAKNPSYSPMVDTLLSAFPDARFIYLARTPLEMIPSYISLTEEEWQILGDPPRPYMCREWVVEMAHHWYTYPLERLSKLPEEQYVVVNFHRMVDHAAEVVGEIYRRLGLEINPAFRKVLHRHAVKARHHESQHDYALQEMGFTSQELVATFEEVFDRFGFDRHTHGARPLERSEP